MKKYGLKIETFQVAGRYQHKIYDIGIGPKNRDEAISNEVMEAQKKVNEMLWEEMPQGATGLVAIIQYKSPKNKN
jgi:flavin-binding protein dodecin